MVNYFWVGMCIVGIIYAIFTGRIEEVNKAIFESATESISICIGLISVLVFWLGVMKIAEAAGLLKKLTKLLYPLAKKIFPEIPENHPAFGYILSNIVANMLGLGNAATPLGLKAMEQLQELNSSRVKASRSMITFVVCNTAGLTILPTTVIVIRMQNNASSPTDILGPVFIATIIATIITLLCDRYYYYKGKKRGR